ncbi:hypothetical protein LTR48_003460 [Friedmanniomyces endolithicus]|uniref:Uncharacterized protein n=1 Tax=Rachicladosporium monterosium TaxID=1507873 RepID=A0ABR0LCJ0_9PEZI|nr:hypothetical protein LTR48_003460 [Friedmanniomyces endolithicus]KAK5146255.1 hypothetical protein LTR32_002133 [Rachicladosporium monterosium]
MWNVLVQQKAVGAFPESDVARQDTMTTWIEYLGYEYWFYDQNASFVRRYQRMHDEAWKKLVDSGVLRPGETLEVIRDIDFVFKRAAESERGERVVQSRKAAVLAAEEAFAKSQITGSSPQADRSRLLAAQAALYTAKAAHESLERRSDAITDFKQRVRQFRNAQKDTEHHEFLLPWIKQQIPLIELESSPMKSDKADAGCAAKDEPLNVTTAKDAEEPQHSETQGHNLGSRRVLPVVEVLEEPELQEHGKRKRSSCDTVDVYPQSKRSKETSQSGADSSLAMVNSDTIGAVFDAAEATIGLIAKRPEPRKRRVSLHESLQSLRPLRRSARIAQQSKIAATPAQRPTPKASTTLKKPVTKAQVKIVNRSCPARGRKKAAAKSTSTSGDRSSGQQGRALRRR